MSAFSTAEDLSLNRTIEGCDKIHKTNLEDIDGCYEIIKCSNWINEHQFNNVCLQFPDELLVDSAQVLLNLKQKVSCQLYILADTSYGSCCVDEVAAEHVKADAVIHFGYACLSLSKRLPVLYIFQKSPLDVAKFIANFNSTFKDVNEKLALLYDVSFYHCIKNIMEQLNNYKNLHVSKLALSNKSDKQIYGRYFDENIENESCKYIYIGSDNQTFFNLIVLHNIDECFIYDCGEFKLSSPINSQWLKRRMYLVEKCKDSKTIGILICTLALDGYLEAIKYIQKLSKSWNKRTYIISVGKPNPAKLANFPEIDMFVLVSCPENTIYNNRDFYKPIITLFELDLALNPSRSYSENIKYIVDFPQLLPSGKFFKAYDEKHIKENDVSLVTGQVRIVSMGDENPSSTTDETAVGLCSSKEVMLQSSALSQKSWTGLEQKLGETQPQLAVPGRYGVAMSYSEKPPDK